MQSIRTRQLAADLRYDGTKYTTAKPWDLATGSTVNDTAIATEAYVTSAVAGVSSHTHTDTKCYVNSNRAGENYVETGSETAEYRTLSAAVAAKLADGQTDYVIFVLRPGEYTGAISRDKTILEQGFEIRGSGVGSCTIQGSVSWDATIGSVLYFRDFVSVRISGVTIKFGAYGLYVRNTPIVTVENCAFNHLGSFGTNHGFERTQAQMAADWATQGQTGSIRSDGGIMRIRDSMRVEIRDCEGLNTLRGFRLQDCASGRISGCTVRSSLESSFYLAAGDYTGGTGCHNFLISDCVSEDCFNNAYLVIGGSNNTISGCRSFNTANSAVAGWHTQGLNVSSCVFEKPTQLAWNGVGNLGDSWGGLFLGGKEGLVDTEGYMLTAVGNSILRIGLGRHNASVGFFFGTLDETVTSFRAVIDNNNTDATTKVHYANSVIPLVNTMYPELLPMIAQNGTDVAAVGVSVAAATASAVNNATDITTNETDIASNLAAIGVNTTAISGNDTDIASNLAAIGVNTTAIAGKQATLSWSTVEDNDQNPVTAEKIKTYVDANAGGSGASLGANTFTANQEIKANSNVKLTLEHTGYGSPMQIGNNYGDAGIVYVGKSAIKFNGNRIMLAGGCTLFQLPRVSTLDGTNAAHGCLVVDDSNGDNNLKLKFHNGSQWNNVSLS